MQGYNETTDYFKNRDGLTFFYRHYRSENEKRYMVISHGLGEHSGRYLNLVEKLCPMGISIFIHDHRGHGKSHGKTGHIDRFDQYTDDLDAMIDIAAQKTKSDIPMLLLGHSMGGLIALSYAIGTPDKINGLVVSSPLLEPAIKVSPVLRFLSKIMSVISPGMTFSSQVTSEMISHDDATIKQREKDPLVHSRVSARWVTECTRAMESTTSAAKRLALPVLMQVAGKDHLVRAEASKAFFNNLTVEDKSLHIYDDMYHEIYNETRERKELVLNDLLVWIRDRF